MITRCSHVVSVLFLLALPAAAGTLHVPGTYPSIQGAIDAAADGDTVLVDPGTYLENINYHGKKIVVASHYILSRDPADILATVIDGSQPTDPDTASVVLFISGEDSSSVLEGFTITGGLGTGWKDEHSPGTYREGGGILTAFTSPTIRHNYIVGNDAADAAGYTSAGGGGIRSGDGNPRIINNVIAMNRGRYGAGIVLNFCAATVRNNLIYANSGGQDFGGSGIWVNGPSSGVKLLENNTIVDNTVEGNSGGGLWIQSASVTARNNIVWNNHAPLEPQISVAGAAFTLTYSDVQGGWFGTGNINADPLFSDSSHLLLPGSPCIDAGNAGAAYNDVEDTANPAQARTPSRGTIRNDMGAYGGPFASFAPYYDGHVSDPLPPSGVTAYSDFATPASVTLEWTDPVARRNGAPIANFKIQVFRDSTAVAVVDSGSGIHIDAGLTIHQQYRYRLRTVMPDDTSAFDSATAYAGGSAVPRPVSDFTTRDGVAGSHLEWRNPSRQLDGTPLNDLAWILLFRDDVLVDSVSQGFADTGAVRTYDDTAQGFHSYRLAARDGDIPPNVSANSPSRLAYGGLADRFRTSFEEGAAGALRTGAWDTTSALASDRSRSLTDSPGADYPINSTSSVLLPPVILGAHPMLSFDHIAVVRPGSYALLDISWNQRRSYLVLRQYDWSAHASWADGSADSGDWVPELVDLSAYAGDTVTVRLRFITGGPSSADGWYVDNIYLGPANIPDTTTDFAPPLWNLASLPLRPAAAALGAVYPAADAAFRYDHRYVAADSLSPGTGYWLHFASPETTQIPGETIASDTIPLAAGWNMVGMISTALDTGRAFTVPPGILVSPFFGFDSHYIPVPVLLPGRGYWVRASQPGSLVLSVFSPPLPFPGKPAAASARVPVTVSDARGRTQALYLAEAGAAEPAPPPPPEGLFDIRFAGGTYGAVAADAATFGLEFRSAEFPLRITWGGEAAPSQNWSLRYDGNEVRLSEATEAQVASAAGLAFAHAAVHGVSGLPSAFRLEQNMPNPFNPRTLIRYALPSPARVRIGVYTSLGQAVTTLADGDEVEGVHEVVWDARDARGREVSSGVYYCRMEARSVHGSGSEFSEIRRMVLVR